MRTLKIAVVGHVEHVTLGLVDVVPRAGDIAHMRESRVVPGGGGALAFAQLAKSDAEVHFFTALGGDDAGQEVRARLVAARPSAHVHAATRRVPHPHVVVMIDAQAKRTIVVTRPPLHPVATDPLPWELLSSCDAVYFTGGDPASLTLARAAKRLVVTARRQPVLAAARIKPDVLVGSVSDPRENAPLEAYDPQPDALVLTDGADAIRIVRTTGVTMTDAPPRVGNPRGDYGAGDSYAAALTYFLGCGQSIDDAARRAGAYGAAVLAGIDPIETQAELSL